MTRPGRDTHRSDRAGRPDRTPTGRVAVPTPRSTDRSFPDLTSSPTRPDRVPDSREEGRYRRRRLLALGGLVLVVLAGAAVGGRTVLLHAERFQVADVEVLGIAPPNPDVGGLDPAQVREAAGIRPGVPLLSVDLADVQRRVAAIPEVASVQASRRWPSTVRLAVTERTPVAEAALPNGVLWVDATGKPFREAPLDAPPLPRLAAATVAPGDPATEAGLAVLASLTPSLREKLQVVEASGPAAVTLRLAGGKQVRWGSPERSDRKAMVLGVLMSQRGSVYDVSAPDLPTIRR